MGTPEIKGLLERPKHKFVENMGRYGRDCSGSALELVKVSCEHCNEPSSSINVGEIGDFSRRAQSRRIIYVRIKRRGRGMDALEIEI